MSKVEVEKKAKKITVHLFPGIHTKSPYKTIGRLVPHLKEAGFKNIIVHDYGYLLAILSYFRNKKIAEKFLPQIKEGDIAMGYSNGGAIIYYLAEMGSPLSGVVLIKPALNKNAALNSQVEWVHVYHTPGDMTVWLSHLLPFHIWGEQGRVGFVGNDFRYTQYDLLKEEPPLYDHFAFFKKENFKEWAPRIARRAWVEFKINILNRQSKKKPRAPIAR